MKNPLALPLCVMACLTAGCPGGPEVMVWDLERPDRIGTFTPEVLGAPQATQKDGRQALCFDGKSDGLLVPINPIEGSGGFTIEILLRPDGDGPPEQRFLHIQDDQERRVLMETRVNARRHWALDTFLRATDTDKLTLLDLEKAQAADRWYWAALTYDGTAMRHFVNAQQQIEGAVAFPPMGRGSISLGVRQNRVHWFSGCIAQVRFARVALSPGSLQRP